MTEQKDSSATLAETPPTTENFASPAHNAPSKNGRTSTVLSVLAIAITLASCGGLWVYGKHQLQRLTQTNQALSDQLNDIKRQSKSENQQLTQQLTAAKQALQTAREQQEQQSQQLDELKTKIATISGNDTQTWLLAQADYLVKMAGRKLWSDQDVTTAAALLKSADTSLAEMNDPSLVPVRRALTQDISELAAINQVDYDGIILKLNQLANGVDNLRLADSNKDETPMDNDNGELTTSLREWRHNMVQSWHNFMRDFITIRRRDSSAEPLLAPNQDVYLRENIRSRLLVAAQAVPRHQDEIYRQSLDTVLTWVRAWFDADDASTKAFLAQLEDLSQQRISVDVPDTLSSQPLLDKLMKTRVRSLLTQPAAAPQQGG